MKLTVSKSKNSASFFVQKSIRKPDGRVTSVTIEKLGNLEQVRARAGGKDPYEWAQEYVNELNRKEYEEQKSIIVSCSPTKLIPKGEQRAFNCGYLFLQRIYYSLGLHRICNKISEKRKYDFDLNDILSKLVYTRIIYPASKRASTQLSKRFIEQPTFQLHDVYRALKVLSEENDFIQAQLYKNSQKVLSRRDDILYYDCTNFFFEIEQEDDFRKYGKNKQHQPLPQVGMGLFMDHDGIPMAFNLFEGNKNEQGTLKPLEQKIIKDYGIERLTVCTDAGLSSKTNRKFNSRSIFGEEVRSFITTQSIKKLPEYLKEFALGKNGWRLIGDDREYSLDDIDPDRDYHKIFYKDRWIKEDLSGKQIRKGEKPLEQHLIVSFSLKYQNYLRKIRQGQIARAQRLIETGQYKEKARNQNDPKRFIGRDSITADGELCSQEVIYLNTDVISEEEKYDGFYAVCTSLSDVSVSEVIHINKKRWEIEECFRIMKQEFRSRPVYMQTKEGIEAHFLTCFIALFIYRILEKQLGEKYTCEEIVETLKSMMLTRPGEKMGYLPAYTRNELTDHLHTIAGFRTDYQITTDVKMRGVIRQSKGRKK